MKISPTGKLIEGESLLDERAWELEKVKGEEIIKLTKSQEAHKKSVLARDKNKYTPSPLEDEQELEPGLMQDFENEMKIPTRLQVDEIKFVLLERKGKKPFEKNWQNKFIKYDNFQLQQHLSSKGNYGVMGGGPKNLVVIDFDDEKVQEEVIKKLPKTFTVKTGSGLLHKYFFSDACQSFKIFDKEMNTLADIQGEGKQVVGASSIHPNGNEYELVEDVDIAYIDYAELKAIMMPYDKKPKKEKPKRIEDQTTGEDFIDEIKSRVGMESLLSDLGVDTSKNPSNCLFHSSKGGKCLGWTNEVAHCFHCDDSWNIFSLVKQHYNCDFKEALEWLAACEGLSDELKESRKKWKLENAIEKTEKIEDDGKEPYGNQEKDYLIWSKKWERYFVDVDKVAESIEEMFDIRTIWGSRTEKVYYFDGKIFVPKGRGKIKTHCEHLLNSYARTKDVNEIFEKIKRKTEIDQEDFEKTDLNLIPLQNGVYNLKEEKLQPHDAKYNFTFILPTHYDKDKKPKVFLKFLKEAMYPDDIPLMKKWFGFQIYRHYFLKKAVIILGEKDTGKTVLLNVLTEFIGEKNKTGLPLQKLSSGSDFNKLSLKGKHSNIFDELTTQDLRDGGGFKMAVGDGYISGEEKFGEYSQFRNFAKHTFATNKIPSVKDNDDMAYFSRWMIFRFDNRPTKIDPFLIKKLTTQKELSGILNWALEGLKELLKEGSFNYGKEEREIKKIMELSGAPLFKFSEEVLENKDKGIITKDDMFTIYTLWANENEVGRMSKEQLGRVNGLQRFCKYIVPVGGADRAWKNVRVKGDWNDKFLEVIGKTDTLDTSLKFKGKPPIENNINDDIPIGGIDMIQKEASEVSPKLTKKQIAEAGYSDKQAEEILKIQKELK